MKDQIDALTEFHKAFLDSNEQKPTLCKEEVYRLRYNLMKEENEEYLQACIDEDIVEIADALGDKLYVLLGTIHKHGLNNLIEIIFNRIHESNMSKLDEKGKPVINGKNGIMDIGKPIGKILKSDRYKRVNLTDLFKK